MRAAPGVIGVATALAMTVPSSAAADSSPNPQGCHGALLHEIKATFPTNSTAVAAAHLGESVQDLQKSIDLICELSEG